MKPQLSDHHLSYKNHRRQAWLEIFLPILFIGAMGVALAAFVGFSAFGENGAPQRWAAISTIWLVIPALVIGVLLFLLLIVVIYLMTRLLKGIPPYTAKAQYYVNRTAHQTRHYSDLAVKPVLFIEGILASMKAFIGRK